MRVRVKLFAQLRDRAGVDETACDVRDGATVDDVWQALCATHETLTPFASSVSCAINAEYAKRRSRVEDGDEVAFLPPVSGG